MQLDRIGEQAIHNVMGRARQGMAGHSRATEQGDRAGQETRHQLDAYRCIRVYIWGMGIVALTSEGRRARPQQGQALEDSHMQHACQNPCQVPKERGIRCQQLDVNQLSPCHILHQTSMSATMIRHTLGGFMNHDVQV